MQAGRSVGDRGAGAALAARGRRSVWMAWLGLVRYATGRVRDGMVWHGMAWAVMGIWGVRVDGVLVLGCA
jgi:hypothetical protein